MKVITAIFWLFVVNISSSEAQKLDAYKKANVIKIITAFKQQDLNKISRLVNYPLVREYPIPSIKNANELRIRFHEVFDDSLVNMIARSKTIQWNEVGWRGIMLDNGVVWTDSYDGKIFAVNYQSSFEKNLKDQLIEKQRQSVHVSLQKFIRPFYKIKTAHYLIRIDEVTEDHFRYVSWKKGKLESTLPDLVLENGQLELQGNAGNLLITFTNNNYSYRVYRNVIGEEKAPDITLEVEKDGVIILTEGGRLMGR